VRRKIEPGRTSSQPRTGGPKGFANVTSSRRDQSDL
jgi:hypothetical protein